MFAIRKGNEYLRVHHHSRPGVDDVIVLAAPAGEAKRGKGHTTQQVTQFFSNDAQGELLSYISRQSAISAEAKGLSLSVIAAHVGRFFVSGTVTAYRVKQILGVATVENLLSFYEGL